ncbi:hypothetical protein HRI_000265400 [Hibiscus trionum]|uniref:Uncharacterized protein n=1 Tax=Hibiscus trionum TaxID=183268 RepID=A0A9W7LIZ5_HIBTR|nr:hypothetical protein HRI_000265400 [Hibiscus trionum]
MRTVAGLVMVAVPGLCVILIPKPIHSFRFCTLLEIIEVEELRLLSGRKEVTVRSSTEVIFQPQNSTEVCKFKISSISSLSLSA